MTVRRVILRLAAALLLAGCAPTVAPMGSGGLAPAPEAATAPAGGVAPLVVAERAMVVAAHPLAAEAGLAMLRAGGTAADAALAAQLVLGVVEPQSSGLGGGAFLLHWEERSGVLTAWDGRETAPQAAGPDLFLGPDGRPLPFMQAVVGGRSVGVPGVPALLAAVHRAHGRLPWADLFAPAIHAAEDGFPVGPRLHALLADESHLASDQAAAALYYPGGRPAAVGAVVRNPAQAAVLRRLATEGTHDFYRGALARAMVAAVRDHPTNPGRLSLEDLAAYRPLRRVPVCAAYRDWVVCGMGPPSSGGVAVGQILGLIERFDLAALDPRGVEAAHLLAEAGRLAFADRNRYLADPDFVEVPARGLLDPGYLAARSALIDPTRARPGAEPGQPAGTVRLAAVADGLGWEMPSTTHVSVVDGDGNAVALTSSIENAFGARLMVGGFLLNNQLTDFAFNPADDGRPAANRVAPGKRPRSSMAPTMVFGPDGDVRVVAGSPGGASIIGFVARALSGVLDHGLDPAAAVSLPHVFNRNGPTEIEDPGLEAPLTALGHQVRVVRPASGLGLIVRGPDGRLFGGADPRREGVAVGE